MKYIKYFFASALAVSLMLCSFTFAQDLSREIETKFDNPFTGQLPTGWVYDSPEAVLFDNGPYFNILGGGPVAGSDASLLQNTALLMTTLGAGHQLSAFIRIADDFTIPAGETWTIDDAIFYAYQTGSTTTTTINHYNVRIWDGVPGALGSNIVFGDTTTNMIAGSEFSNAYRHSETSVGTTRPLMKSTVIIGTTLTEGTYWIDWQAGGTLASGPWAPPIVILGQNTTGNAVQKTVTATGNVWAPLNDGGSLTPQGFPFMLNGTVSSGNPNTFFDNFDSYTAGVQLCTQTTNWQPWGGIPGAADDPVVATDYAWSSPNSVKILLNDDLVRLHGSKTTGKWFMSFAFYIPATKSGYFNTMNGFAPNPNVWGMDAYFDVGGAGRLDTTGGGGVPANTVNFTWNVAQWNQAIVIVDLDTHLAEFWISTTLPNLTQVATWDWTQNGTKVNRLDCTDIFGAAATDEMYVDDFFFSDEMPAILPVELTSFAASVGNNGQVTLNWTTATELNNQMFEIERRITEGQYSRIGYVNGNGTTTQAQSYSFTDRSVEAGKYFYRLKQIDFQGTFEYSNEIEVDVTTPLEFVLGQNYPNPFNPSTKINFSIAQQSFVKLAIYNMLGEQISLLKNENMDAGRYEVTFDASNLPSGMYLYKLETANFTNVKKMVLIK